MGVCRYYKHTCVHIYKFIFMYLYIQAISSMDCSHCLLTCLKIPHMLFLLSSFMTCQPMGYHDVIVTPQAFNMVTFVIHHQNYLDLFSKPGRWCGTYRSKEGNNSVFLINKYSNCSTECKNNSDAYNAIIFHFYTVLFFFCSFYFCSCSSLLPLFFGLDVNVPLGKVRLFYLFPQS